VAGNSATGWLIFTAGRKYPIAQMPATWKPWLVSLAGLLCIRKPLAYAKLLSSSIIATGLLILGAWRMESCSNSSTEVSSNSAAYAIAIFECCSFLPSKTKKLQRRQAAAITRRIALLRAHGLLRKAGATHRYHLTKSGQRIVTALLAARNADVDALTKMAA
jgi:hypothetical protein